MKRFLQTLLVVGFCFPWCHATPVASFGRVAGRVSNEVGSPLAGATVLISSTFDFAESLLSAVTNKDGDFQLANLEPGQYALRVTQKGYQSHVKAPVDVRPGSTTKLVLILQNLLSLGDPNDPANWDFKTVLRSSQERRLIFRDFDTATPGENKSQLNPHPAEASLFGAVDRTSQQFTRAAAVEIYATGPFDSENYYVYPNRAGGGLKTNFGYSVPIGKDSRYLLAGQINSGYDSVWKLKNQLDLHLNDFQVWTFSATYSRLGFPAPSLSTLLNPNTLSRDTDYVSDRGSLQTLTFGVESYYKLLQPVTLIYGLDVAILKGPSITSFALPQLQVLVEPSQNMSIRALVAGKRSSESNSVKLPTGEAVSLSDPFRFSRIDGSFTYDRTLHYEVGVARRLPSRTTLELGTYADRQAGSPVPLLAVLRTTSGSKTSPFSLTRSQSNADGLRILVNKRFWDFLSSSVAYVYGSGATITGISILGQGDALQGVDVTKEFFHSLTTQVDADLARTQTHVSTMFRWVPGSPITTLDSFSDMNNLANGSLRVTVRQVIPVPDFWGTSGRWEALFDMRNIFEADDNNFQLPKGNLTVLRNPRFVRLGIAFRM